MQGGRESYVSRGSEDEIKEAEGKVERLRTEVYGYDTKIQLNKFKNEILELKISRLGE